MFYLKHHHSLLKIKIVNVFLKNNVNNNSFNCFLKNFKNININSWHNCMYFHFQWKLFVWVFLFYIKPWFYLPNSFFFHRQDLEPVKDYSSLINPRNKHFNLTNITEDDKKDDGNEDDEVIIGGGYRSGKLVRFVERKRRNRDDNGIISRDRKTRDMEEKFSCCT